MRWRPRSTGEIIALTMMEVFLTFLFVVLTFTTVREVETAEMDEKLRRYAQTAQELSTLNDEVQNRLDAMRQERDTWRLRYESEFPPRCPQQERFFVAVTLVGNAQLEVHFNEDIRGSVCRAGQQSRFSEQGFATVFTPVLAQAKRAGCRYTATIRDTPAVSKEELKRLQRLVKRYFYADVQ